jgi:hypothetical protein
MMWLGYFFLLRPSKYLCTTTKRHFTLADVILHVGDREFRGHTITYHTLQHVTSVGFEFRLQKNGVSGDIITMGATTVPYVSPVKCVVRKLQHIRLHTSHQNTPLHFFWDQQVTQRRTTDRILTAFLRLGAAQLNLEVACTAGALRCTGATALLKSGISPEFIKLIGRWRSDEVFRYLHLQESQLTADLAQQVLGHR